MTDATSLPLKVDPLQAAIFPIVWVNKADGAFHAVGSAFSISGGGKRDALLVSAAHVFEDKDLRGNEGPERHHPSALFVPERGPLRLKRTLLCAMVVQADGAHFFARIDDVMTCPGNDLALAVAVLSDGIPEHVNFADGLTIDSAMPAIGSEIMVTGYGNPTWETVRYETRAETQFKCRLDKEVGRVVDHHAGYRLGTASIAPAFQVDVPIAGGMSGGPVLRNVDGLAVACGVNASDEWNAESLASGRAAIVQALGPLERFFVRMKDGPDLQPANVMFNELRQRGMVRDISWPSA